MRPIKGHWETLKAYIIEWTGEPTIGMDHHQDSRLIVTGIMKDPVRVKCAASIVIFVIAHFWLLQRTQSTLCTKLNDVLIFTINHWHWIPSSILLAPFLGLWVLCMLLEWRRESQFWLAPSLCGCGRQLWRQSALSANEGAAMRGVFSAGWLLGWI